MSRYKKKLLRLALSLLIVAITSFAVQKGWLQPPQESMKIATPGTYRVVSFNDGDTITVDMDGTLERIRMIGVDTPETQDPRKNVQCFGKAASDYTKQLIGDNPVRLEADPQNSNRDRYSRLLRYVYLPDGTLVQAKIIEQGYGFAYTAFPFSKLEEFRQLEDEARENSRGLWSSCSTKIEPNGAIHTNDAVY